MISGCGVYCKSVENKGYLHHPSNYQETVLALIVAAPSLCCGFVCFFYFNFEIRTKQELVIVVSLNLMESIDFSLVPHFLVSVLESYLPLFNFKMTH